eukprot:TRINITY_DN17620_c0_g2_i1.p5 TRINITY_DN17620_c0_g2~~TRINITY_DN17620_c0_g2_i1.p5  ORF type:complete len:111 (-),score=0.99 TRINITY_DN17620_c0_g2_i1:387-719(-)
MQSYKVVVLRSLFPQNFCTLQLCVTLHQIYSGVLQLIAIQTIVERGRKNIEISFFMKCRSQIERNILKQKSTGYVVLKKLLLLLRLFVRGKLDELLSCRQGHISLLQVLL